MFNIYKYMITFLLMIPLSLFSMVGESERMKMPVPPIQPIYENERAGKSEAAAYRNDLKRLAYEAALKKYKSDKRIYQDWLNSRRFKPSGNP